MTTTTGEAMAQTLIDNAKHLQNLPLHVILLNAGLTALVAVGAACLLWGISFGLSLALKRADRLDQTGRRVKFGDFLNLTSKIVSFFAILGGIFVIARIWGFDPLNWTETPAGQSFASTGARMLFILFLAALSLEGASLFMQYVIARLKARANDDFRRAAQLNTLGPILRSALQTTILVITGLTLLSQVGVQIVPVLAGAGVVGVAVGFGAQTLVKDFFTGFFLIVEDIVAIGDVVQIQNFSGEVEEMTLRTIRLRDFDGTLHIFPYGEAQVIHNLTKTFSFSAFDLPIKYDADIDLAIQLMEKTSADMQADPVFGPKILSSIEIPGVDMMADTGITIKARIKTLPLERWKVGREFNRRIKTAFDAANIAVTHK